MKIKLFLICCGFFASCHQSTNLKDIHMIAIEENGIEVPVEMLTEGMTPSKIYCYYLKDGIRIKDGQEYDLINKQEFKITDYSDGKAGRSYLGKTKP